MPYTPQDYLDYYLKTVLEKIEQSIFEPIADLNIQAWTTPEPVVYTQRMKGKKLDLKLGDKWGNLFDCAWFRFTGKVPNDAAGKKIVLLLDINGEMLVVDKDGNPYRGLTNVSSVFGFDVGLPGKRVLPFLSKAKGGEKIEVWADAGCNDLFGNLKENGTVKEARVAICHEEIRQLYYDFLVLQELRTLLPIESARCQSILGAMNEAADLITDCTEKEVDSARKILAKELKKKNGDASLTVTALGHAHIDLAWLWPIRETLRKGARTFSTVLELMERYPDYIYGASQPQLYQWMKEYYPALYRKIKQKVKEGRIEPLGGMWVESDTSLTSGESLVRQFLYGKRFFRQEFNKDLKNLWVPDVFGYTGSLPQICKKAGVDYFLTIKMSWNAVNKLPHNTFFWEGIDGSKLLTHFPPEDTYNSSGAPRAIWKAERQYRDSRVSDAAMVVYGIGDGGGGPGPEHLELLSREKNLNGLVPVVQETAEKFFRKLEKNSSKYKTWKGEFYLERHQGTLTTQARNKRNNRKMEIALREAECLAALGTVTGLMEYPAIQFETLWKETLLYQFHDILPGSSITRVYDESLARYEVMKNETETITQQSSKALFAQMDTRGMTAPAVILNSLSWNREEWLKHHDKWVKVKLPSLGYQLINMNTWQTPVIENLKATTTLLENEVLKVKFASDGAVVSVFDKENKREVMAPHTRANQLAVYEDKGDAWDFVLNYDEKSPGYFKLESSVAKVDGPLAEIRQTYTYGTSRLVQKIQLFSGSRRVDFVTEVDWKETHKMLRTSFPVDIHANEAACDIQFGHIKRPTSSNTSWEAAQYEIPAQKYVDLSEKTYGVALLNDCKYGHQVKENVLDLNLLRSPVYPDPVADKACHFFTYSLYPHAWDHLEGGVIQAGYELNNPLRIIPMPENQISQVGMPPEASFCQVEPDNVILETIKKAEDSQELILRLYEAWGTQTPCQIHLGLPLKKASLVNLMEEELNPLKIKNTQVELDFKPFEIHTLKLSF